MITWISKSDLIFDFTNDIETPLITENGLFIQYYHKTPLYLGLVKNEMDVTGSKPEAIEELNDSISKINLQLLQFKTPIMTVEELFWVKRLLSIILYKLNYNIFSINHEINDITTLTPTVQITSFNQEPFTENIYYDVDDNDILNDININSLIGYKPLIDLVDDRISLDIVSSDLIWTCDLSSYNYDVIYDIPVIKVNGEEDLSFRAKYIEFSMNPLLQIQSNIYSMMKNTFSYDNIDEEIVKLYNFKMIDDHFLQHDVLNKYWLDNFPSILISGDWVFEYKSNLKTIAYLKYAAIRAYVDTYKTLEYVNDIKVGFDLIVNMPILNDNIKVLKDKISYYMSNTNPFVYVTDKDDAIMTYVLSRNSGYFLAFPIYNQWVVVGDNNINFKNNIAYHFDIDDEIIGLKDFKVSNALQKLLKPQV